MSSRKYQILSLWSSTWTWGLVWDRAVPWWTMAKREEQTSTRVNCDEGWMMRKQMCDQKNRRWECRGRKWGGKRERTLPAAAVGGPNGEMRKGWETVRQGERERDGHREKRDFQGETSIWETEREKERAQGLPFIRSSLPPIDYQI